MTNETKKDENLIVQTIQITIGLTKKGKYTLNIHGNNKTDTTYLESAHEQSNSEAIYNNIINYIQKECSPTQIDQKALHYTLQRIFGNT